MHSRSGHLSIEAVICLVVLTASPTWATDSSVISVDRARTAALEFVALRSARNLGPFPQWKGATVSVPVLYYDFSNQPAAYCYPVVHGAAVLGYIMVGAHRDLLPIQEFSSDLPLHLMAEKMIRQKARDLEAGGTKVSEPRYYYPCATLYLVGWTTKGSNGSANTLLFTMSARNMVAVDELTPVKPLPLPRDERARAAWANIGKSLDRSGGRPGKQKPGHIEEFRLISNVPSYPGAGADSDYLAVSMILGYWGVLSHRDVLSSGSQPAETAEAGQVSIRTIADRVSSLCRSKGYDAEVVSRVRNCSSFRDRVLWNDCRKQIDQGCPMVADFGAYSPTSRSIREFIRHALSNTLVAVGYCADESGRFLILREPLFMDEDAPAPAQDCPLWAQPGLVFCNWYCRAGALTITSVRDAKRVE